MSTTPLSSAVTPTPALPPSPQRHHRLRWTLLSVSAAILVVLLTGGWILYRAISVVNTKKLDGSNSRLSFFQQLTHIVTSNNQKLQGEADGRINILLLGIGGPGHDGPYLTDTMIVASIEPSSGRVALLSIPRDLVVNIPGYDYRKINNVLSFGRDQKYPGGGEALTVNVVSDMLDIPIQYYARIDFTAFQEIVDQVGGIDVTVDKSFADYSYPTNNYGYQTVKFTAGTTHMNGDLALKFARSRHGNNGEGSDFARSRRQQKILLGLKQELFSFGTLANPKRISDILGSIGTHSQTNMEVWEMVRLAKLAEGLDSSKIVNKVIDDSSTGLVKAETGLGGAFILVPTNRTYADLQFLAQNIFLIGQAEAEHATVGVVNATNFTGLADTASHALAGFGLSMTKPVSLHDTTSGTTVILDNSGGRFPATVDLLGRYKRAHGFISLDQWTTESGDTTIGKLLTVTSEPSTNLNLNSSVATAAPNVLLILGQDQPKTVVTTIPQFSAPRTAAVTAPKKTGLQKTASLPHL